MPPTLMAKSPTFASVADWLSAMVTVVPLVPIVTLLIVTPVGAVCVELFVAATPLAVVLSAGEVKAVEDVVYATACPLYTVAAIVKTCVALDVAASELVAVTADPPTVKEISDAVRVTAWLKVRVSVVPFALTTALLIVEGTGAAVTVFARAPVVFAMETEAAEALSVPLPVADGVNVNTAGVAPDGTIVVGDHVPVSPLADGVRVVFGQEPVVGVRVSVTPLPTTSVEDDSAEVNATAAVEVNACAPDALVNAGLADALSVPDAILCGVNVKTAGVVPDGVIVPGDHVPETVVAAGVRVVLAGQLPFGVSVIVIEEFSIALDADRAVVNEVAAAAKFPRVICVGLPLTIEFGP